MDVPVHREIRENRTAAIGILIYFVVLTAFPRQSPIYHTFEV